MFLVHLVHLDQLTRLDILLRELDVVGELQLPDYDVQLVVLVLSLV